MHTLRYEKEITEISLYIDIFHRHRKIIRKFKLKRKHNFDDFASKTNKKNRNATSGYESLQALWDTLKGNPAKAYRVMCSLPEEKMEVETLEAILIELFTQDPEALERLNGNMRADVKRLIRMYDYLKWGKKSRPTR